MRLRCNTPVAETFSTKPPLAQVPPESASSSESVDREDEEEEDSKNREDPASPGPKDGAQGGAAALAVPATESGIAPAAESQAATN